MRVEGRIDGIAGDEAASRDACCACARALRAQESAYWDQAGRTVTCLDCLDDVSSAPPRSAPSPAAASAALDRGSAGASARRDDPSTGAAAAIAKPTCDAVIR